jgi:DNA-binding MarR family transcriptional regulator
MRDGGDSGNMCLGRSMTEHDRAPDRRRGREVEGHAQHGSAEPHPRWERMSARDPSGWPVGRLLSAAARRVERDWNGHLASWDLNHASQPVLVILLRGPHTQAELAALCEVTEQTMSRVVSRLERSGYLTRTAHPTDRRKQVLTVTDAGRAAVVEASDPAAAEAMVTDGLTPEQVDQLRGLLLLVARRGEEPPAA